MGVSKVIVNGVTKVDLTSDTVAAGNLLSGYEAHGADGNAVTGSIASKSSTDLTVSGNTVSVPAGYYASAASKSIANGSATTPATTITANPTISVNSTTGLISSSVSASKSITPSVSAGYVSSGTAGTVSVSGSNTSQLSTQDGTTIAPTEAEQTAVAAGKYTLGAVKVGAISSTYVGSDIPQNDSTDLTASGNTVSVPAGYYASNASKSIPQVTQGAPVATKGTVSNNSVSVTPKVTLNTGYTVGGTITGSAVTVSASELVSGNKTINQNGTGIDVTNYATVTVNVDDTPDLQAKTGITPTESSQTITADAGYYGLSSVQINAIDSEYVGSDIPLNDSTDLTASGATVTVPAGYYADTATKAIASGTAKVPSSISSTIATLAADTTIGRLYLQKSMQLTPVVTAGYIESGTQINALVTLSTDNVTILDTSTITPGTTAQTISSGTYINGTQTISGDANLVASNIANDVSIFGVTGSLERATAMTAAQILAAVQAGWV